MTIKEKARRYDDAIIKAKALYGQPLVDNTLLETILPELKESEDERIRKEIMQLIQCMHDADTRKERWIAWLKKQGQTYNNIKWK